MAKQKAAKGKRAVTKAAPAKKSRRRQDNVTEIAPGISDAFNPAVPDREMRHLPTRLETRTEAQYNYLELIKSKDLVFGIGPAGTGKSYVATAHAAMQFRDKCISQIIVTRPVVATESMGFLPGTEEEKCAPYFEPIRDILEEWLGESYLEWAIKRKKIRFMPLAFMRGKTLDNAFVILDEAQNSTPKQMKLLLSRIGENCTVIVDGDIDQKDIPGKSGLEDALHRLGDLTDHVGVLEFEEDDIVRSGFARAILKRYRTSEIAERGDLTAEKPESTRRSRKVREPK